jgi:hypothetical protein
MSLNVQRRDMTAGQRAIVAARALPVFEGAAGKRMKAGKTLGPDRAGGRARDDVAKVFKVGHNAIQQAKAVVAAKTWGLDGHKKVGRPRKEKMVPTEPFSLDGLAKQFKVSKHDILQARTLLTEAPDLAAPVEARRCTIEIGKDFTNYA